MIIMGLVAIPVILITVNFSEVSGGLGVLLIILALLSCIAFVVPFYMLAKLFAIRDRYLVEWRKGGFDDEGLG